MPLARIITRSQGCSRELALDLLARGYAVEIVPPDKVPDNFADLELRIDVGRGDQLIANVEAHDGKHTASFEFVHHLKAPMADFMRRPPQLGEVVTFSHEPMSFNAKPGIEEMELFAEAPKLVPRTVSPTTAMPLNRELDSEKSTRLIAPEVVSPPATDPPGYFAAENAPVCLPTTASPTIVPPTHAARCRNRSGGWPWRVALAFAGVALLAAILGFGLNWTGKAGGQSSGALPVEKIADASADVKPLSAIGAEEGATSIPGQILVLPLPPSAVDSKGNSSHAPKEEQVAKVGGPTSPRIAVSRKRVDDLIARDTVTYLDKRYEPATKAKAAEPRVTAGVRNHTTHGAGVIAANSVTYFNKPAPKGAK